MLFSIVFTLVSCYFSKSEQAVIFARPNYDAIIYLLLPSQQSMEKVIGIQWAK